MPTKYIVNNQAGQTINGQTFVPNYKSYVALLTQSGGDNPNQEKVQGDTLDLGVTYYISANSADFDLSFFGAPNNNVGTYFVCTQSGILNAVGTVSLLYNTGAPTAIILENTIGNIWFTYSDIGRYQINSDGLFTSQKTFSTFTNSNNGDVEGGNILISMINANTSEIDLQTGSGSFIDDAMVYGMPIEIRVYN